MKYLTKEWYNTMQNTSHHLFLKEDIRASQYSEEYFQVLYKKEENKWNSNEYKVIEFKDFFSDNMDMLKNNLPKSILNEVCDIRVLALNYATKEVIDKIKKFCKKNENIVQKAFDDYNKDFERQFRNCKPKFINEWGFHDCNIITFKKIDKDYHMNLDNTGSFTEINNVIFKNAKIIKQESDLNGTWWLYDEIYKTDDKYEIHVLLWKEDLIDFIIQCSDVVLK